MFFIVEVRITEGESTFWTILLGCFGPNQLGFATELHVSMTESVLSCLVQGSDVSTLLQLYEELKLVQGSKFLVSWGDHW